MAIVQSFAELDWLDQVLHAVAGAAIVGLSLLVMPWWAGVLLSMAVAVGREQWQHPGVCHAGCRTDLAFWLGGSLLADGCFFVLRV